MSYADPEQQRQYLRDYRKQKRAENPELARYDARERKRRQRPEPKRTGPTKSVSAKKHLPTSDEHVAWAMETAGWGGNGYKRSKAGTSDEPGGGGFAPTAPEDYFIEEPVWEPAVWEPAVRPSSLDQLADQIGFGWLKREPKTVRAVIWKVVRLGGKAVEPKFSQAERVLLEGLYSRRRVERTPAYDVKVRSWDWSPSAQKLLPRPSWRYQLLAPDGEDYEADAFERWGSDAFEIEPYD